MRETILRASFKKVEEISDFEEFLSDAIHHISTLEQQQISDDGSDSSKNSADRSKKTFGDSLSAAINANGNKRNQSSKGGIKVGTLENLKEVQFAFLRCKESLMTGLADDNLFSTTAEDYKQWSSAPNESPSDVGSTSSEPQAISKLEEMSNSEGVVDDLNNLLYGPKSL
jgi:hypothetical protein